MKQKNSQTQHDFFFHVFTADLRYIPKVSNISIKKKQNFFEPSDNLNTAVSRLLVVITLPLTLRGYEMWNSQPLNKGIVQTNLKKFRP